MNKKCCILFITHKEILEGYEEESLKQCIKVFGSNRPIKIIIPNNVQTEYYDKYKVDLVKVSNEWLNSLDSYNYMSCDKNFWKMFDNYEYVLIYQTDCWTFEDKLDYFLGMGYDWYGAPWPFWGNAVGNSGLCLRRVNKMLDITKKYNYVKGSMHDDVWFCKEHKDEMNICPWEIAVNFSLETVSSELLRQVENIPMGFHGKDLIKLWDDDGCKFIEFKKTYLNNINNIDIFICTHKQFNSLVSNEIYKIVNANKINNDTADNGIKGSFYSEIMSYKYINENWDIKKYVGFCSYRKYFNFKDNIPNIGEIFKEYDAIVAKPIKYKNTVKEQYQLCHNIEDLYIIGGILADKYPSYTTTWHNFINGNMMIPYNMFIMKKEDFKEYIKFIFDVLDEYIKIVGTDIYKRIASNNDKYIKSFSPNNTTEYQYRIGGYLGERLTNVFLMSRFKKMKPYEVIITEDKYK